MRDTAMSDQPFEVHDPDILAQARGVLNACQSGKAMQDAVIAAVKRNEQWRGAQCINLLAPEAPTSPAVRALLAAEVGIRAAEGHIGKVNRWFAGTMYIDEIEALCVELLKRVWLMLDSRVVMDQFRHNRLFLQAFNGGLDQCDIFEGSCLISRAYVFCGVCKTPESNMSLAPLSRRTCSVSDPVLTGAKIGARIRPARLGVKNVSTTVTWRWPKNRLCDRKQS
jgi:hypothetical protein